MPVSGTPKGHDQVLLTERGSLTRLSQSNMSSDHSRMNQMLTRLEDKLSEGCPVDINGYNLNYFKTMLTVPVVLGVPVALFWCFIPASWAYYFVVMLILTTIHCIGFDSPAIWRLLAADFSNENQGRCLYELAKWRDHNPFRFMDLLQSDEAVRRFPPSMDGWKEIAHGDMMLRSALLGYPEALFEIGLRKAGGQYPELKTSGFEMVLQAAQSGSSNAQALIGNWHLNGVGTPKDIEKALHWLSMASERGNHVATCDLGEIYFHGNGVKKDKKKGIELLKKSADAGVVHAQKKVGLILFRDAKNSAQLSIGLQYIIDASNAGNVSARIFLAMLAIKHKIKMTPLEGYAVLLHLSRDHEEAEKALAEVSHRFTNEEKLEAKQMVEELNKLLKIRDQ
jgi:TPR repeat protein